MGVKSTKSQHLVFIDDVPFRAIAYCPYHNSLPFITFIWVAS